MCGSCYVPSEQNGVIMNIDGPSQMLRALSLIVYDLNDNSSHMCGVERGKGNISCSLALS